MMPHSLRQAIVLPGVLCFMVLAGGRAEADSIVPLTRAIQQKVIALGKGVVGDALPAKPITDPSKLYHLRSGSWQYRITEGANKGQLQTVKVERVSGADAAWKLEVGNQDIQQLRVTVNHEVEKLSQIDLESDRGVIYRPGLVLTPGMKPGETKTVKTKVTSFRAGSPDEPEHTGTLDYKTTYVGAYRVNTPAGSFATKLLIHRYDMSIGPATVESESYTFYADQVGNVAEAAQHKVRALLLYRRSSETAKVLATAPTLAE